MSDITPADMNRVGNLLREIEEDPCNECDYNCRSGCYGDDDDCDDDCDEDDCENCDYIKDCGTDYKPVVVSKVEIKCCHCGKNVYVGEGPCWWCGLNPEE